MTTKTAPIETQEPRELDIHPTEEEAQLMGEWRDKEALGDILQDLKATHNRVEEIHGVAAQEAARKVAGSTEARQLREEGMVMEALFLELEQERERIRGNPQWSEQYQREQMDALADRFQGEIQKRREILVQLGQTLKRMNSRQRTPSPSPEIASEGSLALQRLPHIGPTTLISEVKELLEVATDPAVEPKQAFRASQILQHVYRGVLATKAQELGIFRPVFQALGETVELHFDTLTFGPRHRAATAIADGALQSFDFLVNTFQGPKTPWDRVLARMSTNDIFVW